MSLRVLLVLIPFMGFSLDGKDLERKHQFISQYCLKARRFQTRNGVLKYALRKVTLEGSFLELGVYQGTSINYIASLAPEQIIYGFDSFEGLPEDWVRGNGEYGKGHFALADPNQLPKVAPNVVLVKGWFQDTLPRFALHEQSMRPIAFLHIDCDLYSSTKCALQILGPFIEPGTIIVFDELYGYPGYENHELKAFEEFLTDFGLRAEFLAYNSLHEQVAVRIVKPL